MPNASTSTRSPGKSDASPELAIIAIGEVSNVQPVRTSMTSVAKTAMNLLSRVHTTDQQGDAARRGDLLHLKWPTAMESMAKRP